MSEQTAVPGVADMPQPGRSVIDAEIARFDRLSAFWWNARGPMRPLHVTNALHVGYLGARTAPVCCASPAPTNGRPEEPACASS